VINVGYDADRGCSIVTESEGYGVGIGIGEGVEPIAAERAPRVRPRVAEESVERAAGAA
jgi:hypothetical protein